MSHNKLCSWMLSAVLALSGTALAKSHPGEYPLFYLLTLDGTYCGFPSRIEGGALVSEVTCVPGGPKDFVSKHLGKPQHGDFVLLLGAVSAHQPIYDWIAQTWRMNFQLRNGSVIAMEEGARPKSERQFTNALLTETTIPEMNAEDLHDSRITVKFSPQTIRWLPTAGKPPARIGEPKDQAEGFAHDHFRLQIDGIDCSGVIRIDSFTVKLATETVGGGNLSSMQTRMTKVEFPNLKMMIPEPNSGPFIEWYEHLTGRDGGDSRYEKNGSLSLLSRKDEKTLVQIKLFNLGVVRIEPLAASIGENRRGLVEVELYVERMEFVYMPKEGASGSTGVKPKGTISAPAATTFKRPG